MKSRLNIGNSCCCSFNIVLYFKILSKILESIYLKQKLITTNIQFCSKIFYSEGTNQVLAYADDINLIIDNISTIGRNADVIKCLYGY
jgi:hypothetical protein